MKGYFRKRNGKWSFTIDVGKDPATGRRKQKSRSGFNTKKEAQAVCAQLINEIEQGEYRNNGKMLVCDYMKEYIKHQVEPNLRASTIANYKKTLKVMEEHLGGLYIQDVTPMHIQSLYTALLDRLSPGTIKLFHACTKKMLTNAYEYGVIKSNPAVVKPPKVPKKKDNYWTLDECRHFLNVIEDDIYYLVYALTIYTGMRKGEILGLPHKNVDAENNQIHVRQQLISVDGKVSLDTENLKNESSVRTVEVPAPLMNELREFIKDRRKKMLEVGIPNEHGLVFTTSSGRWVHPTAINGMFRKLVKKHDMKPITFHGLRHSHATMLAELQKNVHAISAQLGHSSATITNDTYIHLTDKMKQSLSDDLNSLYQKEN